MRPKARSRFMESPDSADTSGSPVLDPTSLPIKRGSSNYPVEFRSRFAGRDRQVLGDALGLTAFGVNLVRLASGAASSVRHWHTLEDEFVMVLAGEVTLVTNAGPCNLGPGMVA